MPLSNKGLRQAREAGNVIQQIVGKTDPVIIYVSPYRRTKQTLEEVKLGLSNDVLLTREEPRLREQDFGNFQNPSLIIKAKKERTKFGRFFYRFPDGESGADVFDRIAAFCHTFHADLENVGNPDATAIFITHGITARLFVMRWLHWSVEDFEGLYNPPNCGLLHLRRVEVRKNGMLNNSSVSGSGRGVAYRLTEDSRKLIKSPQERGLGRGLQLGELLAKRRARDEWDDLGESGWGL